MGRTVVTVVVGVRRAVSLSLSVCESECVSLTWLASCWLFVLLLSVSYVLCIYVCVCVRVYVCVSVCSLCGFC